MTTVRDRRTALFETASPTPGGVVVTPGPALRYLADYAYDVEAHGVDHPCFLAVAPDGTAGLVVPALERDRAAEAAVAVDTVVGYDTPTEVGAALETVASSRSLSPPVGVVPAWLSLADRDRLRAGLDDAALVDVTSALVAGRSRKDPDEVAALSRAAGAAETVLDAVLATIDVGMTEVAVDRALKRRAVDTPADRYGVGVVTSGPRTADNYADPTDRALADGDLVLVDTGVVVDGYWADVTRTVALGDPGDAVREMHAAVLAANRAAREAARAGMTTGQLDGVARDVIADAGFGDAFPTDLGHGIGLEAHEPPTLAPGGDRRLAPGHVVTIEPGVYVEGVGGVRIEDEVVIREDGAEGLTHADRSLRIA